MRHGDEGYAKEELVAELGAAFLCADLAITPGSRRPRRLYRVMDRGLTERQRAIFSAAAMRSAPPDYLHGRQPQPLAQPIEERAAA